MSGWRIIYYKLLNFPLKLLVKSKVIPQDPVNEQRLDPARPIFYVLPYNSKADLLTLRTKCLEQGLPDPLQPLQIDGKTLRATFSLMTVRVCSVITCLNSSR